MPLPIPMRFLPLLLLALVPLVRAATDLPAPGPHAVGLRVVQQYDYSRAVGAEPDVFGHAPGADRARPMQTLVWYPAQAGGQRLAYLDYLQSGLTEDDFALPAAEIAKASAQWTAGPAAMRERVAQRMLAARDARPLAGRYPVVIYAPSFAASAAENAELCEHLASHGYVVLASASRGARGKTMTDDLPGLNAQAADIAFLVAYAYSLEQADTARIAAMGFSWGGLANVFAAARSNRIKALVSLDGSVRTWPELIAAAQDVTPAMTAVPMLSVGARAQTIEQLNKNKKSTASSYLNSMKYSDVYLATMQPMTHMHFAGVTQRLQPDETYAEYSRDEVTQAYGWTVRYVRAFLDAYLKGDAGALAFLKNTPERNGVPRHMMAMEYRPARAVAPSDAAFIAEINRRGHHQAQAVYKTMRENEPAFKLSPMKLNMWGYQLLRKQNPKGAAELFKLAIAIEPEWGGVHDSLGEAYEALGEPALALAAYERALALDPSLASTAARVKTLREQGVRAPGG